MKLYGTNSDDELIVTMSEEEWNGILGKKAEPKRDPNPGINLLENSHFNDNGDLIMLMSDEQMKELEIRRNVAQMEYKRGKKDGFFNGALAALLFSMLMIIVKGLIDGF